jgi:Holliday junction DNA helicase RuvB
MSELDRLMTSDARREDSDIETSLRPHTLKDYVGQEQTKKNLTLHFDSEKEKAAFLEKFLSK